MGKERTMHMRFSAGWLIGALAWGLGLGLGASPALGQRTGIELRPKWESAEPTRYRVDEEMIQEISGTNNTLLEWHRTLEYTERVIERDAEAGTVTVERTYDRVAVEVAGEGVAMVAGATVDDVDVKTTMLPWAGCWEPLQPIVELLTNCWSLCQVCRMQYHAPV